MAGEGVPWACVDCGALAIHRGRGRKPERCDTHRKARHALLQRQARIADRGDQPLLAESPVGVLDPEPSKAQEPPRRYTGMAIPAGPKRGRAPLDLTGCPDDLPSARIWVAKHVFGVELYAWQKRELYRIGARDRPRRAYVQIGRKNGKSLLVAIFILTEMVLVAETAAFAVSDSERSLNSVLMREVRVLIGRSWQADAAFLVTAGGVEYPANGSFFQMLPNKFGATQGINPTLAVVDEVHLQKSDEVWNGLQSSGAASRRFLLLGITTPGYDMASFAHEVYQQAKAGDPLLYSRIFEPSNLACDLDDEDAWRESNPRLEDDPDFMEAMRYDRLTLPEHEFRRFRLGIWTATESAWLPHGLWDSRSTGRVLTPTDLGPNDQAWLGFDGSFSGDSTALVVGLGGHISVAGCWENPGRKGWRVPREEVETTIAAWMGPNRHVRLLADPPYWGRELQEWTARWPGRVIEFPTHVRARMAPACTQFFAAVMDGTITHDGDKRLARHVANCITKPSLQGDYITKPDPTSPAKIDLAVAAVVAFSASAPNLARGPAVVRH